MPSVRSSFFLAVGLSAVHQAVALDNGLAVTPQMGWVSSFV